MRIDIFIVLLIAAILLYRWYQKLPKDQGNEPSSTEMVQDPNCEIYIPESEAIRATIDGRDHCFCSEKCAAEYRKKHSAV
jgi:YHS domain-containing protein